MAANDAFLPYLELVFDIPLNQAFTYKNSPKNPGITGKRALAPFGRREALGYIVGERDTLPEGLAGEKVKEIRRVVDEEIIFGEAELELARWVSSYYLCSEGEALAAMIPSARRTSKNGAYSSFADETEFQNEAVFQDGGNEQAEGGLSLSDEQQKALGAILNSQNGLLYLYGITGSGKTEVFLRAAEQTLKAGFSVIYLVPEISLTHQAAEAITGRFGSAASTLHSGMTLSARLAEWMRILTGEARIVVGPRSAVFAPVQNLGLIIIDEEHDGSYKSGNTPRYHARQVAMHRCSRSGVKLIMGSATPSAEAWNLMREDAPNGGPGSAHDGGPKNGILRLNLTRRLSGGSPPKILPVSLENTDGCLSSLLKDEIRETARMGRQTILFLNRRGFAYFYNCPGCGYELTCRNCSVSLTYHKAKGRAVCHYCGYSVGPPEFCPECGSLEAGFTGFGTEMIEEEVRRTFTDLRISRADADTTTRKGSLKKTLDTFRSGEIDILLGTQMVAKGLNFPGVRLVGVVMADTGLHLPDFRAAERTFSLIVQVAGRAGRYFPDGKVIVQTFRPREPAISRACELDLDGFYKAELQQRETLNFPPYSRLIRFTIRSKDDKRALTAVKRLASCFAAILPPNTDLLGPAECPIALIAGNFRYQLILRGKTMAALHNCARKALEKYEKGRDNTVYVEIDVDPVSLL